MSRPTLFAPRNLAALLSMLAGAALQPALAASSASSASSEGSSASSGSVSDSLGSSSDSSKTDKKVAAGDYRIVQVASGAAAGRLRVTLEGLGEATARVELLLPRATVEQAALAEGGHLTVREHGWGLALATGTAREGRAPFFLVLHDAQQREFATTKITL